MIISRFPDGLVEIGIGDSTPPGHIGQHTNVCHPWYRRTTVNSDGRHSDYSEWKPAARTMHKAISLTDASMSCEEFEQMVLWNHLGEL